MIFADVSKDGHNLFIIDFWQFEGGMVSVGGMANTSIDRVLPGSIPGALLSSFMERKWYGPHCSLGFLGCPVQTPGGALPV